MDHIEVKTNHIYTLYPRKDIYKNCFRKSLPLQWRLISFRSMLLKKKKKEKEKERSVDVESMYFDVIMMLDQFCRLIAHALYKSYVLFHCVVFKSKLRPMLLDVCDRDFHVFIDVEICRWHGHLISPYVIIKTSRLQQF